MNNKFNIITIAFVFSMLAVCCGSGGNKQKVSSADFSDGEMVYKKYCQACHQLMGTGIPKMYPPLANNQAIANDPEKIVSTILHGLSGKLVVNGVEYDGIMAMYPNLSDKEIADVTNYIRFVLNNGDGAEWNESHLKTIREH